MSEFTVGVEEELMLLEADTLQLAPRCSELISGTAPDARFREELQAAQVEVNTPGCLDADAIGRALLESRRELIARGAGSVRLAGSGTHPFAPAEGTISPGARYVQIAAEYQWPARRALAWGLHVHVAVPGADRALAVHDAIRSYLPEIAALAGNSPFHEGKDTGLHAVRPKLAENFPRQGIPPAWGTWEAYSDFLRWGSQGGAFEANGSQIWWEVRLNRSLGTVEVRVCDQPSTAAESAALAAVIQALCAKLARDYDAGTLSSPASRERIEENRWRAIRDGLEGTLLDYENGHGTQTRARVAELLSELAPIAQKLGSAAAFADVFGLLRRTGSERQREYASEADGDLTRVVERIARLLEDEASS